MTTIHLVRHGEVHNPNAILYGRRPGFRLTDLGQQMAAGLGEVFADHDVALVMASPLLRAIQTATPTAKALGLELQTDARLIEADNKFEGLAINNNRWILAHPRYWSWYRNPFEPSWGEPYSKVIERMSGAIAYALANSPGREAVLVSHQLPIWTMRRFVEGKPIASDPRKRQCALASVTSLTFDGSRLVAMEYWEPVGHLLRQASDMVPGTSEASELQGSS